MKPSPKSQEDLTVLAYPFQLIESDDGVLLKRAAKRILISGSNALSSILLLLSKCSAQASKVSDILNSFPPERRDEMSLLIQQLLQENFLVADFGILAEDLQSESKEDVFYWQLKKSRAKTIDHINKYSVSIVGLNELTEKICNSLVDSIGFEKENIILVDYPLLQNSLIQNSLEKTQFLSYESWIKEFSNSKNHIVLALAPYGGQELLMDINTLCCENSWYFMPVVIDNTKAHIGPLVNPGSSACLECLRQRQNANMPNNLIERMHESSANDAQDIAALHPSLINLTVEIASFELLKYLAQLTEEYSHQLIELDLLKTNISRHNLIRFPFCKTCQNL